MISIIVSVGNNFMEKQTIYDFPAFIPLFQ